MIEPDPDADLVARVGKQDAIAVRQLVAAKLPRLLSVATRMLGDRDEARDVSQEVFLRVWKEAAQWRPGEARFDTWLHRVTLNLCYDRLRARKHREPDAFNAFDAFHTAIDEQVDPGPSPETLLLNGARRNRVQAAMAALPSRQREALVLQYYQELSNVEAAALMGVSVDALESLLSRARRTLREQLQSDALSEQTSRKERPR